MYTEVKDDDFPVGLETLQGTDNNEFGPGDKEWDEVTDFEEEEILNQGLLPTGVGSVASSNNSIRSSQKSNKLSRTNSSSYYPHNDGRFTEGPAVDNVVGEDDLFGDPKEKQRNDIGITSKTVVIFSYAKLKRFKILCSWLGVLCLFIFGFAIFFAIIGVAANVTNDSDEEPRFNFTEALLDSKITVSPVNTTCNLEYVVPDGCNGKINEITGCISGCYLAEQQADCGLFMNINYTEIPRSEKLSKIYLFATADGTTFWQTGRALPITVRFLFFFLFLSSLEGNTFIHYSFSQNYLHV